MRAVSAMGSFGCLRPRTALAFATDTIPAGLLSRSRLSQVGREGHRPIAAPEDRPTAAACQVCLAMTLLRRIRGDGGGAELPVGPEPVEASSQPLSRIFASACSSQNGTS